MNWFTVVDLRSKPHKRELERTLLSDPNCDANFAVVILYSPFEMTVPFLVPGVPNLAISQVSVVPLQHQMFWTPLGMVLDVHCCTFSSRAVPKTTLIWKTKVHILVGKLFLLQRYTLYQISELKLGISKLSIMLLKIK